MWLKQGLSLTNIGLRRVTHANCFTTAAVTKIMENSEETKTTNQSFLQNGLIMEARGKESKESLVTNATEIEINVPWGIIAVKAHGNPEGKPVLAVHGWMDNCASFERLIPLLDKSLYIVAVDLPGHGLSSHIPRGVPYHFMDYIISLRRIVNHFNWTKFSWLGHSMGAGLGSLYASAYPTQIEHLVMLDLVKPITGESGNDYAGKIAMGVDRFLALEEKIQPNPPKYSYDEALDRLMKGTDRTLSTESAKLLMTRGARKAADGQYFFTRDLRLRSPSILRLSNEQCNAIINKLCCATLILKAKDASWYEPREVCDAAIEIYRRNCKVFEFVEVEGNHFVHLNEPAKCATLINNFFQAKPNV